MKIRLYGMTTRAAVILRLLRDLAPDAYLQVTTSPGAGREPNHLTVLGEVAQDVRASMLVSVNPKAQEDPPADITLCVNWRWKITPATADHPHVYIIHDSLLPLYRGHSPLLHAIRNGDIFTGATMFRAAEEIDAGPIVSQVRFSIEGLSIAAAFDRMTNAYEWLVTQIVPLILEGHLVEAYPQTGTPTYAPKVDWDKGPEIDPAWNQEQIRNHIRAFSPPYPSAYIRVGDKKVYVS